MATKPASEEEFFRKLDTQRLKEISEKLDEEDTEKAKEALKELHWMHCPKCGFDLQEVTFKGVLIDRCSRCNGVWLDDGELEKLAGQESGFVQSLMHWFRNE